jgi:hypothetical protein
MRIARPLVFCLFLAASASAQDTVRAIELPRATLDELAAIPLRVQPRVIRQRWLPPLRDSLSVERAAPLPARAVAPTATEAPPAAFVFQAETSAALSPADASGAVGPRHVVGAFNSGIVVQDRTGAKLQKLSLAQFWFSNAPLAMHYDPRVVYDATYDRWVITSIYDEEAVMLAVSETGDPRGAWRRYQINEKYADYSQLVLSGDSIIAGTTHWGNYLSYFFVVPRAVAYGNPATLNATRIDTKMSNAAPVASASSTKWMVVGNSLNIAWRPLDGSAPWRAVNTPDELYVPTIGLPQAGGPPLDAGLGVVETAVEHDGWIYVVSPRLRYRGTQHVIQWCRLNPVTGASQWGTIADPDPAVSYGYPSLAVSRDGAILIGFGIFSPTRYPSSAYVYRTPSGTWSSVGRITNGDSPFTITDRWGDYTSTVVDPVDGRTFWTLQAHTRGGNWDTSWARVSTTQAGRRRSVRK